MAFDDISANLAQADAVGPVRHVWCILWRLLEFKKQFASGWSWLCSFNEMVCQWGMVRPMNFQYIEACNDKLSSKQLGIQWAPCGNVFGGRHTEKNHRSNVSPIQVVGKEQALAPTSPYKWDEVPVNFFERNFMCFFGARVPWQPMMLSNTSAHQRLRFRNCSFSRSYNSDETECVYKTTS